MSFLSFGRVWCCMCMLVFVVFCLLFVWFCCVFFFFFFFQAEDGIRDGHVTGVQTCALPISAKPELSSLLPTMSCEGATRGAGTVARTLARMSSGVVSAAMAS